MEISHCFSISSSQSCLTKNELLDKTTDAVILGSSKLLQKRENYDNYSKSNKEIKQKIMGKT